MRKQKILFIILPLILLCSCGTYKDLNIGNVKSFKFNGFNNNKLSFSLTFPIENPNNYNIVITEINLKAFSNDRPLGILEMNNKITIEKKSKKDYIVPISIKVTNLLGSFSLLTNPNDILKQLSFDGYIKARKGIVFKTIKIDKASSKKYLKL